MLDPRHLLNLRLPEQRCRYDERDTMLYALGIGFGSDPMDLEELRFVYEDGLKAMPTQATISVGTAVGSAPPGLTGGRWCTASNASRWVLPCSRPAT